MRARRRALILVITGLLSTTGLQAFAQSSTATSAKTISSAPASKEKESVTSIPHAGSKMVLLQSSKKRPLVALVTSLDPACQACIKSNAALLRAQNQLGDRFEFVQLIYEAWNPSLKLDQFPSASIYYKGSQIVHLGVNPGDNLVADIETKFAARKAALDRPLSETPITSVASKDLDAYVATHSQDRFLLLHITSPDPGCPSCVMSNAFIREAVRENGEDYAYAEVIYTPFLSASQDQDLKAFLKKHGAQLVALPSYFVFKEGQPRGNRSGLWALISDDLKAFQKQQ
ncbi:MAG: hypothetical protein AB8G23_02355 [Myxococcota bacterium]